MRKWLYFALVASGLALAQFTPRNPECIAPAAPGGGWDFTCRSVAQVLLELKIVNQPIKVTNLTGGGGGVAYANVVTQRNSDANLIVAASPATTVRLAQGQFSRFTERDVRWLGAVAADFGLVAVKADAPWKTLQELVAAWKADPSKIAVGGGSAVGGQDHMKVLLLGRSVGLEPRAIKYVPFDGGGQALTALLGGFIQVFAGDASELRTQLEAGTVRGGYGPAAARRPLRQRAYPQGAGLQRGVGGLAGLLCTQKHACRSLRVLGPGPAPARAQPRMGQGARAKQLGPVLHGRG